MPGKVSIIIPSFNSANWIERVVASCVEQGEVVREIIVVDDHSTDKSPAILKKLEARLGGLLRLYENPEKGGNSARNHGFLQSGGEFVQWLDADDFLLPGKLETQVKAFRDEHIDLVYSDWAEDFYSDLGKMLDRKIYLKKQYSDYFKELLRDNWTSNNNYLIRRHVATKLHEISGWNPDRKVAQDREYFTLAALFCRNVKYVPGLFSTYNRVNTKSVSSMNFKTRLELQMDLELRFRQFILGGQINQTKKTGYLAILNSHVINAFFYNHAITPRFIFAPWNIDPSIIHYKKLLIYPLLYFGVLRNFLLSVRPKKCDDGSP